MLFLWFILLLVIFFLIFMLQDDPIKNTNRTDKRFLGALADYY